MTTKTVREFAVQLPGATRIFEKLGIDYCCGGEKALPDACAEAGVSEEKVLALLDEALRAEEAFTPGRNWNTEPLSALTAHIVAKHHGYLREELPRLGALIAKVCCAHGKNHPELLAVQAIFQDLEQELSGHMLKEEQILFPYVEQLEKVVKQGEPIPAPFFGTVRNPIRMMMQEHDDAGAALRGLREQSAGYTVPADGCTSYETLYRALETLERDLHQHIHLENNILFPRAAELEARA
jgi:regulator of cell morphogenesis and NO signaling